MAVGYTLYIPVNIQPSNATNKKISCKSSDSKIAKVSKDKSGTNCVVTGVKPGTVTITAIPKNNKNVVVTTTVKVTSFKFESKTYKITKGTSTTLLTAAMDSKTDRSINCKSSDTSIAKVTASGTSCVVKGISTGNVVITGTSISGENIITNVVVEDEVKKESVKFATFNVGYFDCGSDQKVTCKPEPKEIGDWIKKNGLAVIGL